MSLFSLIGSAANTMSVFQNALAVTENNVSNASTPGYAKQIATFESQPFDLATGNLGGIKAGPVVDTRSAYAEQSVRTATTQLGTYEQQVNSLTPLQSYFDITGQSGVPAALDNLYTAFSTWATNPTSSSAQQGIVTQAQNVAQAFNTTASNVAQTAAAADAQLNSLVDKINTLVGQLSGYNAQLARGQGGDSGLQASVNSTLENLAEVANITTATQSDGTVDVILGSQTMLLSGTTQNKLSVGFGVPATPPPVNPLGPPDAKLLDSYANDVTAGVTGGQLGSALYVRNQVLPSVQGDGAQNGSFNQLAKGFADRVNTLIGFPLFSYSATDSTKTAATLQVSPGASIQQFPTVRATALTGAAVASPLAITKAVNDMLNLQVDGKTQSITLDPTDTTAAAVAADLNLQFVTLGIGAHAAVTGSGSLVLSTTNTGNNGSIAILPGTANSTLGLTQTSATYSTAVAALTGTAVAPAIIITNIAAVNDTLTLQVDGGMPQSITLSHADTDATTVAADLNAQFVPLGIGAQATVTGGALVLSTNNKGTGSIAIGAGTANSTLGLTQTPVAAPPVTAITGTAVALNDTLNLQVDGKTQSITLNPADTNAATVAADLNLTFGKLGIGAQATVTGGALVLSTTNTGNNGSIAILGGSALATLGLTQTTPTYRNNANATALSLANLANPTSAADEINSQSFTSYFGSIASGIGTVIANAQAGQTAQQDIVTQTQAIRQQISGVDLNAEAANLLQLQRSYQAASKIVNVVDSLTQTILNWVGTPV